MRHSTSTSLRQTSPSRPAPWFGRALVLAILVLSGCRTASGMGTATPLPPPTLPLASPNTPTTVLQPTGPAVPSPSPAPALPNSGRAISAYDIGNPLLAELYVSPDGNDSNDGLSAGTPLQTLTAAWNKIPGGTLAATGYRINLLPGVYPCEPAEPDDCQNFFADRWGTYDFPIILRAAGGPGTATLRGGMDISNVKYLYLLDFTLAGGTPLPTNASGNNLLHLAGVEHVLVRGMTLDGPDCPNDTCNNLQETFKVNQAQYLYVEDSDIGGAWHSAVDYFAVQYGHFLGNHLHTAGQWCMYVKGGTAYQHVEGNEFEHCQLGFQAGQSSNLPMMRSPWLHYEAYDIKFVNNLMHDLPGVGLSVSGGYDILFAYNTLYNVATSLDPGYALLQAVQGERGCSATDELPDPVPTCTALAGLGGWGPDFLTDNLAAIPNRNVYIYNNLVYNPAPAQTLWTHFDILGPLARPAGFQNLPASITTDDNLVIAGNLIWNGPSDHPLGVDEGTGCAPANPTCNASQLVAQNTINTLEPQLVDPAGGDYHPAAGGNVFSALTFPLPAFPWDTFTPSVPTGVLSNTVAVDYDGGLRPENSPPGAFASSAVPGQSFAYIPLLVRSAP